MRPSSTQSGSASTTACLILGLVVGSPWSATALAQDTWGQAPVQSGYVTRPNADGQPGQPQYYQPPPGPYSGGGGGGNFAQRGQEATQWSNRWGQFEPQWPSQPQFSDQPNSTDGAYRPQQNPSWQYAPNQSPQRQGGRAAESGAHQPPAPSPKPAREPVPWNGGQWSSGGGGYYSGAGQWQGGETQWRLPGSYGGTQVPSSGYGSSSQTGQLPPYSPYSPYSPGGQGSGADASVPAPYYPSMGGYATPGAANPYSQFPSGSQWQWRPNDYGQAPPGGWVWPEHDRGDR